MDPVQKALWFVESHSREAITLEDIAKVCNVSAFHLTRAFTATMGLSLMRYVRARRLSEAARQLAQGADDILSVALDAGYGSHSGASGFPRPAIRPQRLQPSSVTAQSLMQQPEQVALKSGSPSKPNRAASSQLPGFHDAPLYDSDEFVAL
jgi:AraC family transcriptional regulator